MLINRLKV